MEELQSFTEETWTTYMNESKALLNNGDRHPLIRRFLLAVVNTEFVQSTTARMEMFNAICFHAERVEVRAIPQNEMRGKQCIINHHEIFQSSSSQRNALYEISAVQINQQTKQLCYSTFYPIHKTYTPIIAALAYLANLDYDIRKGNKRQWEVVNLVFLYIHLFFVEKLAIPRYDMPVVHPHPHPEVTTTSSDAASQVDDV